MRWDRSKGRPEPIAALNRVREIENGEPLVALSEVAPTIRIIRPTVIPFVRKRVAEMLEEAADKLPEGYAIGVTDAWRPLLRQTLIYEFMSRCALEVWPNLTHAQLRRKVNRWVAPVDQKAPPGHCTGAAVDVSLLGPDGEPVDMISPLPRFQANPTYVFGLGPEAQRHREILLDAMLGVGFSNCRDEWWHYSYGDAGWAVRMDLDTCTYGAVNLPEDLYREQQREWEASIANRPNPFLPTSG